MKFAGTDGVADLQARIATLEAALREARALLRRRSNGSWWNDIPVYDLDGKIESALTPTQEPQG